VPLPFGKPVDAWITCGGRDDGGGAQIAAQASTLIFARHRGLRYAHTPLSRVAHAPPGVSTADWSQRWERCFNLGHDETPAAELIERGLRLREVPKVHRFLPRSRTLHRVAHCHKVTDRHPLAWAGFAPELRRRYRLTPKPELPPRPPDTLRVAVHFRRGDVGRSGRFSERFTETDAIVPTLRRVIEAAAPARCEIDLLSVGEPADFAAFTELGATLRLDEDAFLSFQRMVAADLVFTAKSTFSWLAAILGGALVIHEPFWHPPMPGWWSLTAPPNPAALRDAIAARVQGAS